MREWTYFAISKGWQRYPAAAKYSFPSAAVRDEPYPNEARAVIYLRSGGSTPYVAAGSAEGSLELTPKVLARYQRMHPELDEVEIGKRWCDDMLAMLGYIDPEEEEKDDHGQTLAADRE